MPVGFKNGTDGNIQIAIDAIGAAQHPHHFLSVTKQGVAAIVETVGNECCHAILRGSNAGTNFDRENVDSVAEQLDAAGLKSHVMVDCSHGNSRNKHANQPAVVESLIEQVSSGSSSIFGVMMESHLVEGNQPLGDDVQSLTYGQSITDACMSWDTTEPMLENLAQASRQRRQKK
jgi:3-deoxy-7-phosphoheptulonate synthase